MNTARQEVLQFENILPSSVATITRDWQAQNRNLQNQDRFVQYIDFFLFSPFSDTLRQLCMDEVVWVYQRTRLVSLSRQPTCTMQLVIIPFGFAMKKQGTIKRRFLSWKAWPRVPSKLTLWAQHSFMLGGCKNEYVHRLSKEYCRFNLERALQEANSREMAGGV
jgi:hypothetical protein